MSACLVSHSEESLKPWVSSQPQTQNNEEIQSVSLAPRCLGPHIRRVAVSGAILSILCLLTKYARQPEVSVLEGHIHEDDAVQEDIMTFREKHPFPAGPRQASPAGSLIRWSESLGQLTAASLPIPAGSTQSPEEILEGQN